MVKLLACDFNGILCTLLIHSEGLYCSKMILLSQVSPSQPTLIVATCHCDPSELPPLLTSFFSSSTGRLCQAAARLITLDAELPVMEARPSQAGPEHLLQERRNTEVTRATSKGNQSAAGRENAASARASDGNGKPALNAAEKERGYHILAQVCHCYLPGSFVQQQRWHELLMGM